MVPINKAINNKGLDVSGLLEKDDNLYYTQPETGDEAILTFTEPQLTALKRTIILHSKGHYQILRNPSGSPDSNYLASFRHPGQFNRFSIELLLTYLKNSNN